MLEIVRSEERGVHCQVGTMPDPDLSDVPEGGHNPDIATLLSAATDTSIELMLLIPMFAVTVPVPLCILW